MPTQDTVVEIWLAKKINLTQEARKKIELAFGDKLNIHYPNGTLAGRHLVWANARGFSGTKKEVDELWRDLNRTLYLVFQDQVTNIENVSVSLNATIRR